VKLRQGTELDERTAAIRRNVKIETDDFRVHPGKEFRLDDRPTIIKPFCKSRSSIARPWRTTSKN
jgi:hypothetical protein